MSRIYGPEASLIEVWDAKDGTRVCELKDAEVSFPIVALDPHGQKAICRDSRDRVKIWDVKSAAVVNLIRGHEYEGGTGIPLVPQYRFSSDARYLFGISHSLGVSRRSPKAVPSMLKTWDIETRQTGILMDEGSFGGIAISTDGSLVAVSSHPSTVTIWDRADARVIRRIRDDGLKTASFLAFSPDSKTLLTGDADGVLRAWNVADGRPLWSSQGPTRFVRAVAFRSGRVRLVSGGYTGSDPARPNDGSSGPLVLWEVEPRENDGP